MPIEHLHEHHGEEDEAAERQESRDARQERRDIRQDAIDAHRDINEARNEAAQTRQEMILQRLSQQDHTLDEIRVVVKETNGRVKQLEIWRSRMEGVRAAFNWVPALLAGGVGTLIGIVIPELLKH